MNIDERYKRAMIYTIRNYCDDTLIYVGSTINTLSKRFDKHKRDCKYGCNSVSLHNYIIDNDWTNWYIELYEYFPCNNKKELNRREGQVIREIGTININIAGRTYKEYQKENADKIKEQKKEYNEKNADIIKEYKKEYYEDNADKIKEKVKEYQKENAEKIKEKVKEYQKENVDKFKEYNKEYRKKNADKIKEYQKEKVCCNICSAFSTKINLLRHQRSNKCMSKKTVD